MREIGSAKIAKLRENQMQKVLDTTLWLYLAENGKVKTKRERKTKMKLKMSK